MKPRASTFLHYAAFTAIALVTLAMLAGSWISYSGRRDWAATKADLLTLGEKLSFVELTPAPVPEEHNFFAHPMWDELADTVVATSDDGIPFREPRLPEGSRILDQLKPPLSPEMEAKANSLFGRIDFNNAQRAAKAALIREPDPARRREIARWILAYLEPADPLLKEIHELGARPDGRFPRNQLHELPQAQAWSYLLLAGQTLGAHARACLALDRPAEAFADLDAMIGMVSAIQSEPTLMAALVTASLSTSVVATVRQGIEWHAWRESDLHKIESRLSAIDVLAHLTLAIRGSRGTMNEFFEALHSEDADVPEAFRLQVAAVRQEPRIESDLAVRTRLNLLLQHFIDALEVREESGLNPAAFANIFQAAGMLGGLVAPGVEQIRNEVPRLAAAQEAVEQTKVACALERFRITHGRYPGSLQELVPGFLSDVPLDLVARDPMKYVLGDTGFTLWTRGWDGIDDHGVPGRKNRGDWTSGDWVWGGYPGPQTSK